MVPRQTVETRKSLLPSVVNRMAVILFRDYRKTLQAGHDTVVTGLGGSAIRASVIQSALGPRRLARRQRRSD
jgi:hypothetical protein